MQELSLVQPLSRTTPQAKAKLISRLGILLSLALILQLVEGMLPPVGMPGMKLGLANTVVLLTLQLWGWQQALALVFLRQIIGGILAGKLFSVGFCLGLAGGIASIITMQLWFCYFGSREGLVTASMAGAVAHNWGQWAMARLLINHQGIIWYLPILTLAALPCGFLVACLCRPLIKTFGNKHVSLSVKPRGVAVLSLIVLLGVGFPLATVGAYGEGTTATIQVAGQVVEVLDLTRDGLHPLNVDGHVYMLEIKDGKVRILEADCPDQVCVRTGFISNHGQSIVCVPGRLIITIDNPSVSQPVDGYLP